MDDVLLQFMPPELVAVLHAFAAVVTASSVLVAALRALVPTVKRWSESTQTRADDIFATELGEVLDAAARTLDWVRRKFEPLALNLPSKAKKP